MMKILNLICYAFLPVIVSGCKNSREKKISENIFIEKDEAENVYIITEKISNKESRYVVVGNVEWAKINGNQVFGYKSSYKTTTFLETEKSYFFVFDASKIKYPSEINLQIFPDNKSMDRYLISKTNTDTSNISYLFVNPDVSSP